MRWGSRFVGVRPGGDLAGRQGGVVAVMVECGGSCWRAGAVFDGDVGASGLTKYSCRSSVIEVYAVLLARGGRFAGIRDGLSNEFNTKIIFRKDNEVSD